MPKSYEVKYEEAVDRNFVAFQKKLGELLSNTKTHAAMLTNMAGKYKSVEDLNHRLGISKTRLVLQVEVAAMIEQLTPFRAKNKVKEETPALVEQKPEVKAEAKPEPKTEQPKKAPKPIMDETPAPAGSRAEKFKAKFKKVA